MAQRMAVPWAKKTVEKRAALWAEMRAA